MSEIHPDAAAGFAASAEVYERGRPGYPEAAVAFVADRFGIGAGTDVVDVGAGTGKLTRLVAALGAHVVAVEPVAEMRAMFSATVAEVEVLEGQAEALPLPAASADVVVCGQAFHWFEPRGALEEFARILRPGGGLALLWNVRDESVPWVAELSRIVRWDAFARGHYSERNWAGVVAASGRFGPLERTRFPSVQVLDHAGLVDRVASISYVAALEPPEREEVLDAVRTLVRDFPPTFELPYITDVWTADRLP